MRAARSKLDAIRVVALVRTKLMKALLGALVASALLTRGRLVGAGKNAVGAEGDAELR